MFDELIILFLIELWRAGARIANIFFDALSHVLSGDIDNVPHLVYAA
jgi:hypothetical protein